MKINELTDERTDEVIPAIGAVGGALARGAVAAGGALAKGAAKVGSAVANKVGQAMGTDDEPADLNSPDAQRAKQEQKKQLQAQIKATQEQLKALQQQLTSIK